MLRDLHIQNFALIDDLWLEFGPGLTVLTGETGAGKTVLLSALELIMGGRGDSDQVAFGADKAKVEAGFDGDLTVSRTMSAAGRTRVLLNGDLSSVGALQKQIAKLIDLHGQHDHQALLLATRHIEYLDRWASDSISPLLGSYLNARQAWKKAHDELCEIQDLLAKSVEESEAGKIALDEIERIDPQPNEDDELRVKLPTLQHSEAISEFMAAAQEKLRGEGAALESLYELDALLEQVVALDPSIADLKLSAAELRHALDGIADALSDYAISIQHDSSALEEAFERLASLESLAKRYGPTLATVLERKEHLLTLVDVAENSDERLFRAKDEEKVRRADLEKAAQALSRARRVVADDFIEQISNAASDLELGKVRFDIDLATLPFSQWTDRGSDTVEILYAPAPTVPVRSLAKIASGGEVSRVMLALKSVLGKADNIPILIFDEVDAGIGGATGLAIGAKLKQLAETHQVLVVTHLAQVAVYADAHFFVSKESSGKDDNIVKTMVVALNSEQRISEFARMLSGSDSKAALKHAKELFDSAR